MKTIKTILSKTSYITLSLVVGLTLAAGITFAAWTATWHGTDWINSGETISAQKIAENFEYLEARAGKLPTDCSTVGDTLIWNGTSFDCGASGGGGGDNPFLADNGHTSADCTTAGGAVYSTGLGYSICKFTGSSCESGWLQKDDWSKTTSNYCSGARWSCPGTSCSTNYHGFNDTPTETCSYGLGYWEGGDDGYCTVSNNAGCVANVVEVGCY